MLAWGAGTAAGIVGAACGDASRSSRRSATADGGVAPEPDANDDGAYDAGGQAGAPGELDAGSDAEADSGGGLARDPRAVAIVRCQTYDPAAVKSALEQAIDSIGDLRGLVANKTVAIKPNLTGDFQDVLGRSAGETYITHGATVLALSSLLFEAGARRVRIVESVPTTSAMTSVLGQAGWDVAALLSLGDVQLENTRNLGSGLGYSRLTVPLGARLFTYFDVNVAYHDVDVMISLAKLKHHAIAGVTLTMKNLFGITPLSLYGTEAALGEAALGNRTTSMHEGQATLPGELSGYQDRGAGWRVPRIVVDQVAARPIDLAIVDGITSMSGGEGPWHEGLALTSPGVLVAGWNPVATDAAATAVMGYDPMALGGPFSGDNHLLLAHQAGLGSANVSELDVRGLSIAEALYPFG